MNDPKVSVLVPTYNYARFLPEAIESVLSQDFKDFELVVIDDHSPDNTPEVVEPFLRKDPRVRFESNPSNIGMVANWNLALSRAKGRYIKFLFGDDMLASPQALGKMVALLDNNPGATLAASARKIIDQDSRWIETWGSLKDGCLDGKKVISKAFRLRQNIIGEPSAVLFRKADAARGFDLSLRQIVDLEMWIHLLERGNLAFTTEPLCCFRCHQGQQTVVNQVSRTGEKEFITLIETHGARDYLSSWARFGMFYHLRRLRLRQKQTELKPLEDRIASTFSPCALMYYWAVYRAGRPLQNLGRRLRKLVFRFDTRRRRDSFL